MCVTLYVYIMLSGASQVALLMNVPAHGGDKQTCVRSLGRDDPLG